MGAEPGVPNDLVVLSRPRSFSCVFSLERDPHGAYRRVSVRWSWMPKGPWGS